MKVCIRMTKNIDKKDELGENNKNVKKDNENS